VVSIKKMQSSFLWIEGIEAVIGQAKLQTEIKKRMGIFGWGNIAQQYLKIGFNR